MPNITVPNRPNRDPFSETYISWTRGLPLGLIWLRRSYLCKFGPMYPSHNSPNGRPHVSLISVSSWSAWRCHIRHPLQGNSNISSLNSFSPYCSRSSSEFNYYHMKEKRKDKIKSAYQYYLNIIEHYSFHICGVIFLVSNILVIWWVPISWFFG